jgi:O-antigen/teichoic acid export membrane protein
MLASFLWVGLEKFGYVIIKVFTIIILARFLTPEDFGVFGLAVFVISLSHVLVDSGLSGSLIKNKFVSEKDYSTVFVFSIVLAFILYIIFYMLATYIAIFYEVAELEIVIQVSAITLIIKPLSIIHVVKLTKLSDFKSQTKIYIISSILSALIAVSLAYAGAGYWSLVAQQVADALISSLLFFLKLKSFPSFGFDFASFKRHYSFGFKLMISALINTFYNNFLIMIVGKKYSATLVGYYAQANKINEITLKTSSQVIEKVTFPLLSSITNNEDYIKKVKSIISYTTFVTFFLVTFIIINSEDIVILLLGDKWKDSGIILMILSFSGYSLMMESLTRSIFKSKGRADIILKLEVVKKAFCIPVLLFSIQYSLIAMLWTYVALSYFSMVVNMYMVSVSFSFNFYEQISCVIKPAIISVLTILLSLFLKSVINDSSSFYMMAISVLFYFSLSLILLGKDRYRLVAYIKQILGYEK